MTDQNSNVKWYDENAQTYDDSSRNNVYFDLYDNFLKMLPKDGAILDHGCGPGRDAKIFFDKGYPVTGIDLSGSLLKIASNDCPGCAFIRGDIGNVLPFEDNSFEGVWSMASMLHLGSMEILQNAIGEIYRVLKPGGALHILTAFKFDDVRLFETDSDPKRSFLRLTAPELENICKEVGFETAICETRTEDKIREGGRGSVSWVYFLGKK